MPTLVLASTSPYRRVLLARLGLEFVVAPAHIDETPLPEESPRGLALRLARAKAQSACVGFPDATIIGSDQVASLGSRLFGKPGTRARAIEQLTQMSGATVVFDTAVCVMDADSGEHTLHNVPTEVQFRPLTAAEIERYVDREQPYDCAGAAKVEALGIGLLQAVRSEDPTALIGLPLIALCAALRARGFAIP